MNIILLENVEKVGRKFEVVTVKDGFGRNYLIPQGMALVANRQNLGKLQGIKRQIAAKENVMLDTYKAWVANLAGKTIEFTVKAGESGRLFGSITNAMLADKLTAIGVPVERRRILMPDEVKSVGEYSAKLDLHPSLDVQVPFTVLAEGAPKSNAPAPKKAAAVVEAPVAVAATSVVEQVIEEVVAAPAIVEEVIEETPAVVAEAASEVTETDSEEA
jgi:large subunit ribosomal protein L9